MLSEELSSIHTALGTVLGKANPEGAAIIRICRRNLEAAKEQAEAMEEHFSPISDYNLIRNAQQYSKEKRHG